MAETSDSKTPISAVTAWLRAMAERGILNGTTVRLRITAIDQLISILANDEAQDAQSIAENIEQIARRWATKNNSKPETMKDYMSRARGGLSDFFEYQKDPGGFHPQAKRSPRPTSDDDTAKVSKEQKPTQATPRPSSPASAAGSAARSFPLGHDDAVFEYVVPQNWTMRDAVKVFYHLMTYAEDFDPTNPQQAKMFALVRSEVAESTVKAA